MDSRAEKQQQESTKNGAQISLSMATINAGGGEQTYYIELHMFVLSDACKNNVNNIV